METKRFDVSGMSCASCVAHVEKSVSKLPGIQSVNVQLLTNSMIVQFDTTQLTVQAIEDAVKKAGYEATALSSPQSIRTHEEKVVNTGQTEAKNLKHRFWLSFSFMIPLLYLSMGPMIGLSLPLFIDGSRHVMVYAWIQMLLAIPILIVNKRYYSGGFRSLIQGSPTMDSLVAIGSAAAFFYGLFMLYKTGYAYDRQAMEAAHTYVHQLYFESAATILTLVTLGKYLEVRSKRKTSDAITKLVNLAPKTALLLREAIEMEVPVKQVLAGDIVVLKPGSSVPVDGIILKGHSYVDESMLTGESIPVLKQAGNGVLSGSVNQTGYLTYKAVKVGDDATLAQIIRLMEEASASKAPISRLADKISRVFVPIVISLSIITLVVWLIAGYPFGFALSAAIAVLVISCPCALGLATPVAIMVGMGKGAEQGILFKSAESLELAHKVTTILLDKTGTVTTGKPAVTDLIPLKTTSEDTLLQVCASLENQSEHPLGKAILDAASKKGLSLLSVNQFQSTTGKGVEGRIDGKYYFTGNQTFIKDHVVSDLMEAIMVADKLSAQGKTCLFVADSVNMLGLIAVADQIKPGTRDAVKRLNAMGLQVAMLTGDKMTTAQTIGQEVGIDQVLAALLPQDKVKIIAEKQAQGHTVAMVGDGINDAPALTRADLGIAIGAGSDIAIESANVVLMRHDLNAVVTTLRLSKQVIGNIRQNLFWAFFYNILGIPLAAGVFYLASGLLLSPMVAAAAMSVSSATVVMNALRLRRFKATAPTYETSMAVSDTQKKGHIICSKATAAQ